MASAFHRFKSSWQSVTSLFGKKITVPTQTPSGGSLKPHEIQRQLAFYWQQFLKDQPIAFIDICYRCRYYALNSSFLQMFLPLKTSVYNYDFKLVAASGLAGDDETLKAWLEKESSPIADSLNDLATGEDIELESNKTNWELALKFANESWTEWNTLDNAIGFWLDGRNLALTLPPERCLYSDVMGLETMKYIHGLHQNQILQLPLTQQERFKNHPAVFLNPRFGEHFKLLKRAATGDGFSTPGMLSVLKTLGEEESKEIGFHQLAWTLRNVTRHHKLGHEIKSGDRAGRPDHFWDVGWDKDVQGAFRDVVGLNDYTSRFDHTIDFPWPDLKRFDATAWEGSDFKLRRWCGPLGLMLVAKGVTTHLTQLLRAHALSERRLMGPFLSMVFNKAFHAPVTVKVEWGETIFSEDRLRAEMLKFGALQGWVSPQTGTREIGLNSQREQKLKMVAASDENVQEKFMPIYDPSHGSSPAIDGPADPNAKAKAGADAGSKAGTPAGKPHTS